MNNIIIKNPVNNKQENLTELEFYSYMAQTNGEVLNWIISSNNFQKHADHDQSTHGSWARNNFNEETEYEGAMITYGERYGIDLEGNKVGVTTEEHNAIDRYSEAGYLKINQFLRGTTKDSDLDKYEGILMVQDDEVMNERAIEEWFTKNFPAGTDNYEMTQSDLDDAAYQYAFSGRHAQEILNAYHEGKTLSGQIIKKQAQALDSLIDKSPLIFGDKTLFRVYSNKVLEELQEGDIIRDKAFLSTTRIDVTTKEQSSARTWMGAISRTPDTVGIILPNESKSGRGLAVDIYRTSIDETSTVSDTEKEVLLPRNTPLKFIGFKTDVGIEARVAIFQRMDK